MCKACSHDFPRGEFQGVPSDQLRSCREARRKSWVPVGLKRMVPPSKMTHRQLVAELNRQARRIIDPRRRLIS